MFARFSPIASTISATIVFISIACSGGAPPSPVESPPQKPVAAVATDTRVAFSPGEEVHSRFISRAPERSRSVGGDIFGWRDVGFEVILKYCVGDSIFIHDPWTNGEAYVDAAALAVPAGFCASHDSPPPSLKTVVFGLNVPSDRARITQTFKIVADWLRRSAGPGDLIVLSWFDGSDVVEPIRVPPLPARPATPASIVSSGLALATPTPCTNPVDIFCRGTATAEAESPAATATAIAQQRDSDLATWRRTVSDYVETRASQLDSLSPEKASRRGSLATVLARAQRILTEAPGGHWLILIGPLLDPAQVQLGRFNLSGSKLRFIELECADPNVCLSWRHQWQSWANQSSVDLAIYDASVDLAAKVR